MSYFIAKLENQESIFDYATESHSREEQALISNKSQLVLKNDCVYWINIVDVKIPPIYYLGIVFLMAWFYWRGFILFILALMFGLFFYIPFSKQFHIWAFKRGLKKKGYKGSIIILPIERGMQEVYFV